MSHNNRQEYEEFIDKFKPRRTTDDCFTPPDVYEAVVGWLRGKGMISDADNIVRPFCPGGDFERFGYKPEDVVVDNPPFSIMAKIRRFYAERGIHYFLFAPFTSNPMEIDTNVVTKVTIVYDNGALVNTSFVTNMLPGIAFCASKSLRTAIENAPSQIDAKRTKKLRRIAYDDRIISPSRLGFVEDDFDIKKCEVRAVRNIGGYKIFGGAWLLSDRAAERIKAEQIKAGKETVTIALNDADMAIINELNSYADEEQADTEEEPR